MTIRLRSVYQPEFAAHCIWHFDRRIGSGHPLSSQNFLLALSETRLVEKDMRKSFHKRESFPLASARSAYLLPLYHLNSMYHSGNWLPDRRCNREGSPRWSAD